MKRGLGEDEKALARWREKQDSSIDEGDSEALKEPYEIQKQIPLKPQYGDILNNSFQKVPSPKGYGLDVSTDLAFQRFEPELQKSGMVLPLSLEERRNESKGERIISILSHEDTPMGSSKRSPKKRAPEKYDEERNDSPDFYQSPERQKNNSTKMPSPRRHKNDDDEDHLSDVDSDVDSVTRDRYLLACKMLKTRLIEKEIGLNPSEKEFLMSLLKDVQAERSTISPAKDDRISTIESAAFHFKKQTGLCGDEVDTSDKVEMLETLETNGISSTYDMSSKHSAAPSIEEVEDSHLSSKQESIQEISKNPYTPTRRRSLKKSKFPMPTNLCGPKAARKVGNPTTDIRLLVREEDDFEEDTAFDESSMVDDGKFVRFDGWSHHKSMEFPFRIIGADDDRYLEPRVLTPPMMEAFRGFLPYKVTESNFWLKFSLVRDGASIDTLLATVRASTYTIIGVETTNGEVFGAFCGTAWKVNNKWFGNGEAFLWRLKKSRLTSTKHIQEAKFENEMEVYPYTGYDVLVQYCTSRTIAVGGGDWYKHECPFEDEPKGIGFMVDGDLAGGETNSCSTFANPRLGKKLSASNEFTIKNLEVWTLTPFENEKDAGQLEMQKLLFEENARLGKV
jgi:hypothetical protein